MTKPIEQHISPLLELRLDDSERALLRERIAARSLSYDPRRAYRIRMAWYGSAVMATALLVFGSVVGLAAHALPGDALYSVKTNVNQKVVQAVAFNEDSQDDVELEQIDQELDDELLLADRELR
jgi:hypothetical protein